jgi:hypothetical protein
VAKVRKRRYAKTRGGDELTPEVIEALADEAERGYDLSRAKREVSTRPFLPHEPTMGRILVRVTNEEAVRLQDRARAEGRPIPALVHDAAMRYLESPDT